MSISFRVTLGLTCILLTQPVVSDTNSSFRIQQPLAVENVKTVSWEQLPEAVQNKFKWHAGTGLIKELRSAFLNGEKVYLGSFTENGAAVELAFRADGSIAAVRGSSSTDAAETADQGAPSNQNNSQGSEANSAQVSTSTNAPAQNPATAIPREAVVSSNQPDSVRIPLADVPPQVRHTIGLLASSNQVEAVTRSTAGGQIRYDVTYFDVGYKSVRIAPSGTIMNKTGSIEEGAGAELPPARKP